MSATRLASKPDICQCRGPYREVKVPWCAAGQKPLPESRAVELARLKAAQDSSLFGDSYQGQPYCEPVPRSGR